MDIVQGNVVSQEQLALLQPGMARTQVRNLLGTPLLVSVFHTDRWDYVFGLKRQGKSDQLRKVTVFFKGEVVDHVQADPMPTEDEFVATLKSTPPSGKLPALQATPEQLARFAKDPRNAPATAPAPVLALPRDYPPLESSSQ